MRSLSNQILSNIICIDILYCIDRKLIIQWVLFLPATPARTIRSSCWGTPASAKRPSSNGSPITDSKPNKMYPSCLTARPPSGLISLARMSQCRDTRTVCSFGTLQARKGTGHWFRATWRMHHQQCSCTISPVLPALTLDQESVKNL